MTTAKAAHTPGPWSVYQASKPGIEAGSVSIIVWGEPHEEAGIDGANHNERLANARLIAAAPELLESLMALMGHDERFQTAVGGNPIAVDRMLDRARAAIAKATGAT